MELAAYKYRTSSHASTMQEIGPDDYDRSLQHQNVYLFANTSLLIVLVERPLRARKKTKSEAFQPEPSFSRKKANKKLSL